MVAHMWSRVKLKRPCTRQLIEYLNKAYIYFTSVETRVVIWTFGMLVTFFDFSGSPALP